jgi:hypothetical protein
LLIPICFVAGLFVSFSFGRLPAPIGGWDSSRPYYSWTITVLLGVLFVGLLVLVVAGIFSSMWPWTPAGIAALYIVEASRSALLSTRQAADSQ